MKVEERGEIGEMYKEGVKEVMKGRLEGGYGGDGWKGVMEWMEEENIELDWRV